MICLLKADEHFFDMEFLDGLPKGVKDWIFIGTFEGRRIFCESRRPTKNFFDNDFPLELQRWCLRLTASFWGIFSPALLGKVNLPDFLSPFSLPQEEIIFFTGTFAPWHEGHTLCIRSADVSPLVTAPDNNPWKEGQEAPFDRLKTIPLDLFGDGRFLYLGFLGLKGPNPTALWIPKVKAPKVSLVMGDDCFMGPSSMDPGR